MKKNKGGRHLGYCFTLLASFSIKMLNQKFAPICIPLEMNQHSSQSFKILKIVSFKICFEPKGNKNNSLLAEIHFKRVCFKRVLLYIFFLHLKNPCQCFWKICTTESISNDKKSKQTLKMEIFNELLASFSSLYCLMAQKIIFC